MDIGRLSRESPKYRKLRDELFEAERELRDQRERVAALRRRLPQDTVVTDQTFEEIRDGVRGRVRLSDLFEDPKKTLVLVHFMFGKKQKMPCPMCTTWADGYSGITAHLRQRLNLAVLVAGDVGAFADYARTRSWSDLRLVGAGSSDLKRRLGFEARDGSQHPGVSVFRRKGKRIIHTYSVSAMLTDGEFRGMDLLSPLWHFLDLTPEGRGDFFPQRTY